MLQTEPGSWCLKDLCLFWVLSSQQTPGEVIIGCGMTGQQIWAALSFQRCHNRKATMEPFCRCDCAHMSTDCRVVDVPCCHLPTRKFRSPGGQDIYRDQCQFLTTVLYWDVASSPPHWPNIDHSGHCRSQSWDLECYMSSQTWVTQVTRKLHWGGGSSSDPLPGQVAPHTSATEARTSSFAKQLLLPPLHIKWAGQKC